MKKNMLKGICTAAVCIALGTFASTSNAHAASTNPNDKTTSASFFQDSTMKHSKMSGKGKMGGKMGGGKMSSDSSGSKMGGMKSKRMGKSKMDSTNHR